MADSTDGPVEGEVIDQETQTPTAAPAPSTQDEPKQEAEQPKAMTIRDTEVSNFMDPNVYIQMKAMAADFVRSKAIPKGWESAEQVLVAMQTGYEMGMKPMESLKSLYPVNGIINVWGQATVRRLTEHGWTIAYSDESELGCTATITKRIAGANGAKTLKYSEHFSFKEAEQSGYVADSYGKLKVGWKLGINRKLKMRYNCLSLIIKTYVPEVLGSAAGIVEVDQDGTIIEADPKAEAKARIKSAEDTRRQLKSGNFTPSAVAPVEEGNDGAED